MWSNGSPARLLTCGSGIKWVKKHRTSYIRVTSIWQIRGEFVVVARWTWVTGIGFLEPSMKDVSNWTPRAGSTTTSVGPTAAQKFKEWNVKLLKGIMWTERFKHNTTSKLALVEGSILIQILSNFSGGAALCPFVQVRGSALPPSFRHHWG